MAIPVAMPQLGESIVEGTVARWRVRAGERVARDQVLLEVETDKASVEVPSPAAGLVGRLTAEEGAVVPVGATLCEIVDDGEAALAPTPPAASAASLTAAPAPAPAPLAPRPAVRHSPAVRNAALEHGVDLAQVRGSGEGGRVTLQDVAAHVAARATGPTAAPDATDAAEEVIPWSRRRKLIAEHMVASRRVAPHVFCVAEADFARVVALRSAAVPPRPSHTAYLAAAVARALREPAWRGLNATVRGEATVLCRRVHLGIAVDADEGLLVPVVRDADRLELPALARAIADLAERARARRIAPDELRGGTFTLSNPGPRGNLYGAAIIHQPQVAILRMGELAKRPVAIDVDGRDQVVVRPVMHLALSYDHRVVDGALANGFLRRVRERIEQADFA